MNRSKKIISICLALLVMYFVWNLLWGIANIVAASACGPEDNYDYVDGLFKKLFARGISDKEMENVYQELLRLGYEKMETDGYATWYKNVATMTYNGTEYIVETYRAIPADEKSNLACQGEVFKTLKDEKTEKFYRYDIQTNVIFKFVKEKRNDDAKLSLVANMTTGHVSFASSTIRTTGVSYSKDFFNDENDIGIWKEKYSDTDAIKYYLGESMRNQFFCDRIPVEGPDGQTVIHYSPLAPVTTAQVF